MIAPNPPKTEGLRAGPGKRPGGLFYRSTRFILEKYSGLARDVFSHGPGSWQALLRIYEGRPDNLAERLLYPFTLGLEGCRDTRNRLDMYTALIRGVLENGETTGNGGPCEYLDLACGCSFGPIRAARQALEKAQGTGIRIKCSDISPGAIRYSETAVKREGLSHLFDFAIYGINRAHELEKPETYDGVGTHGYIDYKTVLEAVRILRNIKRIMKPGATLIITNMKEKEGFDMTRFMMQFYGSWFIRYKTREEMGNMLCDSGFGDIDVWETPLGHHYIATARKPAP